MFILCWNTHLAPKWAFSFSVVVNKWMQSWIFYLFILFVKTNVLVLCVMKCKQGGVRCPMSTIIMSGSSKSVRVSVVWGRSIWRGGWGGHSQRPVEWPWIQCSHFSRKGQMPVPIRAWDSVWGGRGTNASGVRVVWQGVQIWAQSGSDWPQMVQILDLSSDQIQYILVC